MTPDSIWRCFAIPRQTYGWYRVTPKSYILLVAERIRLRRSERRYAKRRSGENSE